MTTEDRLAALERRANRYRNAFVVLVVAACGVAMIGASDRLPNAKFNMVDTHALYVKTYDGETIGGMFQLPDTGQPILFVSNPGNGGTAVKIMAADDGGLVMLQRKGLNTPAATLYADAAGGMISLYNSRGNRVVDVNSDDHGEGYIGVWDRKGKGRTLKPGP